LTLKNNLPYGCAFPDLAFSFKITKAKLVVDITATIITYNEQDNIERCLDSLTDIADEIVVVDSFSTDKTADICTARSVRFFQNRFEGHIQQKNYALNLAASDYVLALDADEALSDQLRQEIQNVKVDWRADAFSFNRRTNYCGRWIAHSGWYPDKKVRLWKRNRGLWGGVNPHDRVVLDKNARIDHLAGDLLHYSYVSGRQHLEQINHFSSIAAEEAYKSGKRARLATDIVLNPVFTFLKKYFLQLGFLDGGAGIQIATKTAYGKYLKYNKLRELERQAQQAKER
jgi:glycosyltransferase involved in cell wall biosynthesis